MARMELSGPDLDRELSRSGVLLVHWWGPESVASEFSSAAFEVASSRNPSVRFGSVDVSVERALATDYQVDAVPTLMLFRDGILVFSGAGPFTDDQVEQLLLAVEALDMEDVRRGRNGHSKGTTMFSATPAIATRSADREPSRKPLK